MTDLIAVGLVLGGAVLLFAGAALSVYGVVLLGSVLGGGGGYLIAPTVATTLGLQGAIAIGAAVVLGVVAGGVLGYLVLSFAVAAMGFVVGAFVGLTVLAPIYVGGQWYLEWGVALGSGLVAAVLGMLLTKWTMVFISSFVGAAFASRVLTAGEFTAAQQGVTLEPLLFDAYTPAFLALVALGVLSQFGLFRFGYVTKLAAALPGSKLLPGRRGEESEPA